MPKKKKNLQPESKPLESIETKSIPEELEAAAEIATEAAVAADVQLPAEVPTEIEREAADEPGASEAQDATQAGPEVDAAPEDETAPVSEPQPRPPAKLERLQKILAAAGVASRRRAEELIEQGRVQVNGRVVTELGTKADAGRDHIRVDGKLLQGAERLRYFVLNKPKGYVTTVKDPEGRPTVMQFFEKMKERLYPVGRLDYMSEGLLVVTNDGELANRLTRAASGVEKTYLVKVAGQPTEAELDLLRGGVAIDRGLAGSGQVRTSPARIRQVRQGDNPWYEVILIEGRNRELRKMFGEINHFVEKIRRVGYGPLVLDQEPGHLRELEPEEVDLLRKAAEGKLRTPKAKELRRQNALDAQLPTMPPKPSRPRPGKAAGKPFRSVRPAAAGFSPAGPVQRPTRPPARPAAGPGGENRPATSRFAPGRFTPGRFTPGRSAQNRTRSGATRQDSAGTGRTGAGRPFSAKPAWRNPERAQRTERSAFKPPAPARRATQAFDQDLGPVRPPNLHIEEIQAGQPGAMRPTAFPSKPNRSRFEGSASSARSSSAKPFRGQGGLARPFTTSSGKPRAGGARPSSKPGKPSKPVRPFKSGSARSYGVQRPYEARPSSRSTTGPAQRPFRGSGSESSAAPRSPRPYTPRTEGRSDDRPTKAKPYPGSTSRAERKAGPGWKPKSSFGNPGKSAPGARSKPKSGGFSKPGYKAKPSRPGAGGARPRPGAKRPGGKNRG